MSLQPIRFATFLAPNMLPVYQFIATYVAEKLNHPTELSMGSSFDQFAAGQVDVGFICGLPYVVLRGCTWAYNDLDSHSGYNVTRYHLIQLDQTQGFFGRVVAAGWHQRAIQMVCAGEIDAAAIDSQVLAIELRDQPGLAAQLRVIDALGPAAIQPVVAASHLPDSLKTQLRAILLGLGDDPATQARLAHGFVKRFAPVTDATYDDIREMLAAAEAIGFMTIK